MQTEPASLEPEELAPVVPAAKSVCPHCGKAWAARGIAAGAWVRCPGCSQPVQYQPKAPPRPRPVEAPQKEEETLEELAARAEITGGTMDLPPAEQIYVPPRELQAFAASVPAADAFVSATRATPNWAPRPVAASRHIGCLPAAMIAGLASCSHVFFAAAFLEVHNPWELLGTGAFSFVIAWIVGAVMISAGNRTGWEPPSRRVL